MDLNYSPEQLMLKESAARFLSEVSSFEFRRQIIASEAGMDEEVWRGFAELGWLALPFAEENGGLGCGPVEISLLMEEMGKALVTEPFLASVVLAGGLLERVGSAEQRERVLTPLIAGMSRPALAHMERETGSDLGCIATQAVRDGNGYRLYGRKALVLGGASSDTFLVTARLDNEIALFLLPAGAEGLARKTVRLVDGSRACDLMLDSVRVDEQDLVSARGGVLPEIEAAYDRATAALAADAVGCMDALLAATITYTKQRVQFGQPLANFQALQHRMAEMAVKCEEARASALLATLSVDAPRTIRIRAVSGAKAKVGRASRHVAQEAIQLHGAMGYSEEMPVGSWFRRLYAFENSFGSTAEHLARYGAIVRDPAVLAGGLLREPEAY
ncbi:acyl-CoA dehydrogenase [Chelativorans sp.]|uniref:acyl-CoA dehydrogenase family protein n=1 Tax=Chelativorans sp. TaxID=2203393 RepID=UPI0028111087|nr:acyl-CoA dehydrogenase [Chelativorans sp.]